MRYLYLNLTCLCLVGHAAAVQAHDDVVPYAFGGKIVTGGHDDVAQTDTLSKRVFGYDFAEDPSDPYFIGDPGFNNGGFAIGVYPGDGLLPAGKTLGFDVLTNLLYWDGSGSVAFSDAPADVALGLDHGSSTLLISGSGPSGVTPTIGSTGAGGRLHAHLSSSLTFNGEFSPAAPNAPDGIYLVGLQLKLTDDSLVSDPIYFVYNNLQSLLLSADEEDVALAEVRHDQAIDWVQENLVAIPEPASVALVCGGAVGLAALLRRRRSGRRTRLSFRTGS